MYVQGNIWEANLTKQLLRGHHIKNIFDGEVLMKIGESGAQPLTQNGPNAASRNTAFATFTTFEQPTGQRFQTSVGPAGAGHFWWRLKKVVKAEKVVSAPTEGKPRRVTPPKKSPPRPIVTAPATAALRPRPPPSLPASTPSWPGIFPGGTHERRVNR